MAHYKFYDLKSFYLDNPPLIVSKVSGEVVRHSGSSGRDSFWAGYDGKGGITYSGRGTSATASAFRGGKAYRKLVNTGTREALPETY